jgi:hypothetical protein
MRRVKDYNTFLKENELLANLATKKMTRILDPDYESKARVKSKTEIEASLGKDADGKPFGVWDFFEYDEEKGGFVGTPPLFSGEVILRETDDEGDVFRKYEVTSGTNKGITGNFTWVDTGGGSKHPEFELPAEKKWSDILGPDANFLETFVSEKVRWASNISEINGVKIKNISLDGVCEIEYDDEFQFFGNVRIYYSGNTEDPFANSFYSYEVKDGPNKGTKGKGFQIFSEKQNGSKMGIYNPFSNGDTATDLLEVIQYPAMERSGLGKTNPIIAANSPGGSGIRLEQLIFFNTSDLSSIKGPSNETFEYLNYDLYSSMPDYNENTAQKKVESRGLNTIIGKIEKSKLPSAKIYALRDGKTVFYKGNEFPSLDGIETSECYISCYQGQPLILYTVEAKKKDSPSFDNKGIGTYGNRFFVGNLWNPKFPKVYTQVRGEWYYDSGWDDIGIIYAYGVSDKKEITEISNENLKKIGQIIPNQAETEKEKQKEAEKTANNSRTSPFGPK